MNQSSDTLNRDAEATFDWVAALHAVELDDVELLESSDSDPGRRTYVGDGIVWKVMAPAIATTNEQRVLTLAEEFRLVESLKGTRGVIDAIDLREADVAIAAGYRFVAGRPIDEIGRGLGARLGALVRLAFVLFRISLQGISHNDVKCRNVLVSSSDRSVWLIDFDQATRDSRWRAFRSNVFGHKTGPAAAFPSSFFRVARRVWRQRRD